MNALEAGRHSARVARSGARDSAGYPALRAERQEGIATLPGKERGGMNALISKFRLIGICAPLAAPAVGGVDDVAAFRIDLDERFEGGLGGNGSRQGRGDGGREGEAKDDPERFEHGDLLTPIFAGSGPKAIRLAAGDLSVVVVLGRWRISGRRLTAAQVPPKRGERAEGNGDEKDDFEGGFHRAMEVSRRTQAAGKANHNGGFDLYI
jgi:hypothetical protein